MGQCQSRMELGGDAEHRAVRTLVGVKHPQKQEICLPTEKMGVTVWTETEVVRMWQGKLIAQPRWYCWAGQREPEARLGRVQG